MPVWKPIPFAEARESRSLRRLLAMRLDSRQYARLPQELKERAVFASKVVKADFLQRMNDLVQDIVGGATPESLAKRTSEESPLLMDLAKAKLELRQYLDSVKYTPEAGKANTIQDLRTDARLDVMLSTNMAIAEGYGQWQASQDEDILDQWPAQELIRVTHPVGAARDWKERWHRAGGRLRRGRMVAVKNDAIWSKIGSPELFDDGLGNPYPPYAWRSGMGIEDVDRDEAERLGLLKKGQPAPKPQTGRMNETLQESTSRFNKALRGALAADPSLEMKHGVLRLAR